MVSEYVSNNECEIWYYTDCGVGVGGQEQTNVATMRLPFMHLAKLL